MDDIIGFQQAVVWDKGGLGMGIHYRRSYEFVLIAQNGSPSWRWNGGHNESNVWHISKILPSINQHPTQKPVELMREILRVHSNEGDLVLDPFCGSGTTCVAAKQMGRRYIGVELDPTFYAMAQKRVAQAQYEERLFAVGADTVANVVPACQHCNSAKNAKTPEQWVGMSVCNG